MNTIIVSSNAVSFAPRHCNSVCAPWEGIFFPTNPPLSFVFVDIFTTIQGKTTYKDRSSILGNLSIQNKGQTPELREAVQTRGSHFSAR